MISAESNRVSENERLIGWNSADLENTRIFSPLLNLHWELQDEQPICCLYFAITGSILAIIPPNELQIGEQHDQQP